MSDPTPLADIIAGTAEQPHPHPFPGNELLHLYGMGEGASDEPGHADTEDRLVVDDTAHAVVVGSRMTKEAARALPPWPPLPGGKGASPLQAVEAGEDLHRPVIDVDWPVTVHPSSTPGHSHVYIDRPMTWSQYLDLLDALAAAGIVEAGYVHAARRRGASHVRVPWIGKGDRLPRRPLTLLDRIRQCRTRDELGALYVEHVAEWGDEHNEAARQTAESIAELARMRERLQGRVAS